MYPGVIISSQWWVALWALYPHCYNLSLYFCSVFVQIHLPDSAKSSLWQLPALSSNRYRAFHSIRSPRYENTELQIHQLSSCLYGSFTLDHKPSQVQHQQHGLSPLSLASSPCPTLTASSQAQLPLTCLILWLSDPWYSMVRYCTMALAASVLPDPLCPLQEQEGKKSVWKQRHLI